MKKDKFLWVLCFKRSMKRSEQRVYGQKMKLCKREGTTFL